MTVDCNIGSECARLTDNEEQAISYQSCASDMVCPEASTPDSALRIAHGCKYQVAMDVDLRLYCFSCREEKNYLKLMAKQIHAAKATVPKTDSSRSFGNAGERQIASMY